MDKTIDVFPDPIRNKVSLTPAIAKLYGGKPGVTSPALTRSRSSTGQWHNCYPQKDKTRHGTCRTISDKQIVPKLIHLIEYLNSTREMSLTLKVGQV